MCFMSEANLTRNKASKKIPNCTLPSFGGKREREGKSSKMSNKEQATCTRNNLEV